MRIVGYEVPLDTFSQLVYAEECSSVVFWILHTPHMYKRIDVVRGLNGKSGINIAPAKYSGHPLEVFVTTILHLREFPL